MLLVTCLLTALALCYNKERYEELLAGGFVKPVEEEVKEAVVEPEVKKAVRKPKKAKAE